MPTATPGIFFSRSVSSINESRRCAYSLAFLDWAFTALAVNIQATKRMIDLAGNTEGSRMGLLLQAEELFSPLAVSILITLLLVLLRFSLTVNIDTFDPGTELVSSRQVALGGLYILRSF
jgi:hypothetical protein